LGTGASADGKGLAVPPAGDPAVSRLDEAESFAF
jgi:hypothetical protein